jgi:hypothetical protein
MDKRKKSDDEKKKDFFFFFFVQRATKITGIVEGQPMTNSSDTNLKQKIERKSRNHEMGKSPLRELFLDERNLCKELLILNFIIVIIVQ